MLLLRLRRVLASRIVRFAVAGGALWVLDAQREGERRVEIDPRALEALREAQAKKLGLDALPEQGRREVDARAIEDEVLYREALRLGLDKDDPIVRQRLVQKLLLLVEDMGGASRDPTREELRAYFDSSRDRWRKPTRLHFVHVFSGRRESLPPSTVFASGDAPPDAGEAFAYPRDMTLERDAMVRLFGASFSDAAFALAPGAVSDPLRSPFGWHRVKVVARVEGAPASFEEVESELALDFMLDRRERVVGTYLVQTTQQYDIRVGGAPLAGFVPTRRVAVRTSGSAED